MSKCNCYHEEYNKPVCWGTREKDECSCGGDETKCNFYPEKRAAATVNQNKMKLYAARDKNTGKLVSGLTNPSHKFWHRREDCEAAIRRYYERKYRRGNYDLELVVYELVETKED